MLHYQTSISTTHEKTKSQIVSPSYQVQYGVKYLNYLMDRILCQIFRIILLDHQKAKTLTDKLQTEISISIKSKIKLPLK